MDILERKATQAEREQGLDIADFFIRVNYEKLQHQLRMQVVQVNIEQNTAFDRVPTPDLGPLPTGISNQASLVKLKERYPAIAVLVEKLEFEVVNFNTESDDALTVSKLAEDCNKIATNKMAIKGKEGERKC